MNITKFWTMVNTKERGESVTDLKITDNELNLIFGYIEIARTYRGVKEFRDGLRKTDQGKKVLQKIESLNYTKKEIGSVMQKHDLFEKGPPVI